MPNVTPRAKEKTLPFLSYNVHYLQRDEVEKKKLKARSDFRYHKGKGD